MTERLCKKCGAIKNINEFTFAIKGKYGHAARCKKCTNIYQNKRRLSKRKHKEPPLTKHEIYLRFKEKHPNYYAESYHKRKEFLREKQKEFRDRIETKKYYKEWCKKNKDKTRENSKKRREKNKEAYNAKMRILQKEWKVNNREQYLSKRRKYYKIISQTIEYKLTRSMRGMMWYSLSGRKNGSWKKYVDYTIDQLKTHLEKLFKLGMTWENYGRGGWNIDHIIPIKAFNFTAPSDTDFKKCWSLNNLQPLWEIENIIKKDRLIKPFQPSLLI
jgi:hypothetical protein